MKLNSMRTVIVRISKENEQKMNNITRTSSFRQNKSNFID